jgi:hypothetical protein
LGVQMPQLGLQQNVPGAQIAPPHVPLSGPSASVAGTGAGAGVAGGAHSGQCAAQISAPLQPMHCRSGGRHVSAAGSADAAAVSGAARDTSGDRAHAARASPIDAIRIMRRELRDSFRMGTPSLVMSERTRRSIDARDLSIDVNRAHINRVTDGERGHAARAAALDLYRCLPGSLVCWSTASRTCVAWHRGQIRAARAGARGGS